MKEVLNVMLLTLNRLWKISVNPLPLRVMFWTLFGRGPDICFSRSLFSSACEGGRKIQSLYRCLRQTSYPFQTLVSIIYITWMCRFLRPVFCWIICGMLKSGTLGCGLICSVLSDLIPLSAFGWKRTNQEKKNTLTASVKINL